MNPLTPAQFRTDLPEFADESQYPDSMIQTWLTVSGNLVDPVRWGTLTITGQELATAHYVVMAARDQTAANAGTEPGRPAGLRTQKSAAGLSASYDYTATVVEGGGAWNQTSYGQRYFSIARLMGAGGLQIGHPHPCC
jgi:uncharacterized protein DUF4054